MLGLFSSLKYENPIYIHHLKINNVRYYNLFEHAKISNQVL